LSPAAEKTHGVLDGYRIGTYPPRPRNYGPSYEPPAGYIQVGEQSRHLPISQSFRLGEFLTKNQHERWPKYQVLDMRLIDKLELVIEELREMGYEADHLFIMSGYRTPEYNGAGVGGRARYSRHIYGDAADVWLDSTGDGRMDDLNGDGRSDIRDARVLAEAVDRVERQYPDLVGGVGVYGPKEPRGPFVHIDIRGRRARW
ncbi:MAG: D-Ala-D-Ala carboxypeptidase family metallohydrolase, partial [Myxococcota bacterium]